jgi:multidrug efflux pump subunit AcrA (membrane-fusion protein)
MIVIPLILLALIGYWVYSTYTAGIEANTASGFIEGEEIAIAAEVGGRIQAITVEEGDRVTAGQELIRLDRTLLNAQIAQAQAAVETAKAQLAQVKAGARAEEIRQAEAALAQALAARDGAKQAWENAKAARANPQELEARIAEAETQLKAAKFQWDAAKANASAAKARVDAIGGVDQTRVEGKVIVEQWAAAEAAVLTA